MMKNQSQQFVQALLRWYKKNGRDLPWRHTRDPYKILVSEVMLQQTQVDRVIPKYKAFLKQFPTVRALANASPAAVIRAWQGLGYNRRALYLKRAAEAVVKEYQGKFPKTIEALEELSGVGKYTARAVFCFAYKRQCGFVDTNVARVLHRWRFGSDVPQRRVSDKTLWKLAEKIAPKGKADLWHHALMDFGALICTARKPRCATSPVKNFFPACAKIAALGMQRSRIGRAPFKDSDRYWRGRIIDALRIAPNGKTRLETLRKHLHTRCPKKRFEQIVTTLTKEGLLVRTGNVLMLPQ